MEILKQHLKSSDTNLKAGHSLGQMDSDLDHTAELQVGLSATKSMFWTNFDLSSTENLGAELCELDLVIHVLPGGMGQIPSKLLRGATKN